ncbi:MAG: 16S rRNA (cytosine(967)-C(5))-methyltransferase RsmB [Deltaproteobacteria bacterium]|nr:16S rRNA (cytosine(967)-C(5))-methyltransferase RsmB [Deltaproteobacteria bacterium]
MTASNEVKTVRHLASEILFKVDTQKAYADILLDGALTASHLSDRDRALLTELTYGTLRWRGNIDARLGAKLRRSLAATDGFIRNLLRVTVYQLFFLDRIPDYAAVNEAVELAKSQRGGNTAGFVNGVLRNLLRQKNLAAPALMTDASSAALAAELSHPEWLVQRWLAEFGASEAAALMRANNERAPLVLRVNRIKCRREELLKRLCDDGIAAQATPLSPQGIVVESAGSVENLPGFAEGLFQIQGESSQLIPYLLAPAAGERILDACAAPGGKSTHIAELMDDRGQVIALDNAPRAIKRIRENIARLNLSSIQISRADATEELTIELSAPYDRILVDAPCSGLGTLRSHPEIKWQRQASDIQRLSQLQARILDRVAVYLKPGGVLVYSTCTLTRDENEQRVDGFLATHKEFELEEAARYLPPSAQAMVRGKYFQALPQRDNTDGFFAARMRKES